MMYYFDDPRSRFEKGKIQLQTECPFYEPGNLVKGLIWMHIDAPVALRDIEIEVKGKEKVAFTRYWTEQEGDRTVERHHRHKMEKTFLRYHEPVYRFPEGFFNPGAYVIEFSFNLPIDLPSSINTHMKDVRERPKAKIKYFIKAKVNAFDPRDNMKYKQVLIVRERPVEFKMGEQQQETSNITTWCCVDQGTSSMWSSFEKNIFTPVDCAKAIIHVDNSKCTLNVTQVKFFIEQRLTVRDSGFGAHSYTRTRTLVERSMVGPNFGQGGWTTEMIMDLGAIRFDVPEFKKKHGVEKRISPEDAFMMAGVQSAVHSKYVTNDYFLCIELAYDGCTCCANLPDSRMPITIVPLLDPRSFGFTSPDGWMPMNLGGFNFQLNRYEY